LKERETPFSERGGVSGTPNRKRQREEAKKEMIVAATKPSKAEPTSAKRKVRKLVFNLEKDSPKAHVKPIFITVEDESPRKIQENPGK